MHSLATALKRHKLPIEITRCLSHIRFQWRLQYALQVLILPLQFPNSLYQTSLILKVLLMLL
jgi:hypothetical protein